MKSVWLPHSEKSATFFLKLKKLKADSFKPKIKTNLGIGNVKLSQHDH